MRSSLILPNSFPVVVPCPLISAFTRCRPGRTFPVPLQRSTDPVMAFIPPAAAGAGGTAPRRAVGERRPLLPVCGQAIQRVRVHGRMGRSVAAAPPRMTAAEARPAQAEARDVDSLPKQKPTKHGALRAGGLCRFCACVRPSWEVGGVRGGVRGAHLPLLLNAGEIARASGRKADPNEARAAGYLKTRSSRADLPFRPFRIRPYLRLFPRFPCACSPAQTCTPAGTPTASRYSTRPCVTGNNRPVQR